MNAFIKEKGGTFLLNKTEPIHRWYSYVEGYSSCLIAEELKNHLALNPNIETIYDPFCGTGTTSLVASTHGIKSFYSESNPFMQTVIETKINCVQRLDANAVSAKLIEYLALINEIKVEKFTSWNGFEKFFGERQLSELLTIKELISQENNESVKSILALALSSIIVKVSKMTRRGDLRYATEKEYREESVLECFADKLKEMIFDIQYRGLSQVTNWVRLKFAAMNLKKYAIHRWKRTYLYACFTLFFPLFAKTKILTPNLT